MNGPLTRRHWLKAAGISAAATTTTDLVGGDDPKAIAEPARQTPVVGDFDVCVVGGSCTGVFAAVAAARLGARVAIVENLAYFGGVATASLVNIWHSIFDTTGGRQIIGGLTVEVVERLKQRQAVHIQKPSASSYYVLNSPELAIELDALVAEAGVRPFLHTRFAAAIVDGDRVVAAVVEDKGGRRAIRARYFVDATGDGDLLARAGGAVRKDSALQPPTTCAIVTGLDEVARRNKGFSLSRAIHDRRYAEALKSGFCWDAAVPGIPGARMVAGTRVHGADCSDPDELTRAEVEGRRQVRAICDVVRNNFEGGAAVGLAALPARIGIRETRHAVCRHTLTEAEVLGGVRFPDAIANGTYRVDIHFPDRGGLVFRYLNGVEEIVVPGEPTKRGRWRAEQAADPTFYQVPYRSIVPKSGRNVLAAGRLVDADRGAFGAVRVMVNCNQMGQAAGTAAALALRDGRAVADVPPDALRKTLAAAGAIVC